MAQTEELAVALKEQDILAVLDTIIDPKVLPQAGKDKVDHLNVTKPADLDAMGDKVALIDGTTGINFDEIILDGDRATVSDIDDPNAAPTTLERFISIAGLRHSLDRFKTYMETPRETYALIGNNPTMKMEVEDAGHNAQMQVLDKKTGHAVASMEWIKSTQEFSFALFDNLTGVVKATFEIKPDGKAYIGTKQVATLDDVTSGPKGDTGADGAKGGKGDTGPAGPKGADGAKGDAFMPALPTADGDYKLNIAAGVATWVTV